MTWLSAWHLHDNTDDDDMRDKLVCTFIDVWMEKTKQLEKRKESKEDKIFQVFSTFSFIHNEREKKKEKHMMIWVMYMCVYIQCYSTWVIHIYIHIANVLDENPFRTLYVKKMENDNTR